VYSKGGKCGKVIATNEANFGKSGHRQRIQIEYTKNGNKRIPSFSREEEKKPEGRDHTESRIRGTPHPRTHCFVEKITRKVQGDQIR